MPVTLRKLIIHKVYGGGKNGLAYRYDHSSGRSVQTGCGVCPEIEGGGGGPTQVETFLNSVKGFNIPIGFTKMDIVLVGGGGGGVEGITMPSPAAGGGGGGGGYSLFSNISITVPTLNVTVGDGGAAGQYSVSNGGNGLTSQVVHDINNYNAFGGVGAVDALRGTGGIGTVNNGSNGTSAVGTTPGTGGNSGYTVDPTIGKGGGGSYVGPAENGAKGIVIITFHN